MPAKVKAASWLAIASLVVLGVAAAFLTRPSSSEGVPSAAAVTLTSVAVPQAPVLDGDVDALWNQATEASIPVVGGANMGSTTVLVRSVYTADSVYFLLHYADPTESLHRQPWQKQADGTWKKLSTSTTHQENTYYEDKAALIWDINIAGFAQAGCAVLCHAGEQPANSGYGSKYTANAGELGDIWHWKSVRTNPVGQVDDQYVDSSRYDPQTAPEAGRKSDPKTGGGYSDNKNADNTAPGFTAADQPAPPYWILDSQKQPFTDTYQTNDEIAGIIVAAFTGDRGDISGKGVYRNGHWYLEIGRKLTTGSDKDVQFSDLSKPYYFGAAVFDSAQVNHAFQSGASQLVFAAAQTPTPTPAPTATPTPAATATPTPIPTATPVGLPKTGGSPAGGSGQEGWLLPGIIVLGLALLASGAWATSRMRRPSR